MSDTKKDLFTHPILRKGGEHTNKKYSKKKICPDCEGLPLIDNEGREWVCPTCEGEGLK